MKRKVFKILGITILTLVVSAMVLAPIIARWYVNKNGMELIGRNMSLEKIRINYLTFTFRIIGFKIYEKDNATVFTGFDTLLVDLQPLKLVGSELAVKRLYLINPVAEISKRDTVFNFSDIIEFFSSSDTTVVEDTTAAKSDYKFEFRDIRFSNGRISYTDEDINNTTILNKLSFSIPYISWNQTEASQAGLKFNFLNGGYFSADGNIDPGSGNFTSNISINSLDISDFSAYIKPYVYLNSISGLVDCSVDLSGNTDLLDSLSASGRLSVKLLEAIDNKERKILGSEKFLVTLDQSQPMAGRYFIDSLALYKPYLYFEMADSSNNFLELFPPEQADTLPETNPDTLSQPLFYNVNTFIISDGIVDFIDRNLEEPFKYHLSRIKLNVDSISSLSTWLTAYSTMKLNEQGDLKAEIGINPSDPYELKVEYVISNFQLTDFSPYSKFYVGSAILYGNMYYTGKTSVTARQITSENKLIIKDAELSKRAGGIFNLPLRLALYLLKDLNGDIKIDLPLTGDLNDPEIKIGRLIWTTFKNLIIKVAATPFIALANLFGMDQKDLQQIDFNYSDTLLTDINVKKLDHLIQIKQKKPELDIELAYFNDRAKEKEQIAFEEAVSVFEKQTGNDYNTNNEKFRDYLKTALQKDSIDLYSDCIIMAGDERVNAISRGRDSLRVKLIEDYLKLKDTLNQIKILIPNTEAVKNVGSQPVFEIKFSMED